MPVVTTMGECLVDFVPHGTCRNTMTFGQLTMSGGPLEQRELASKVLRNKVCPSYLGTRVPTVRTAK